MTTTDDHTYWTVSEKERAEGFVRPLRFGYRHIKCSIDTTIPLAVAESFAHDPKFYTETFCTKCRANYPVSEFFWLNINNEVLKAKVGD